MANFSSDAGPWDLLFLTHNFRMLQAMLHGLQLHLSIFNSFTATASK